MMDHFKREERFVDLDCSGDDLLVRGDVKMVFIDKDQYGKDKMFHIWFHTGFIENNYLCFEKMVRIQSVLTFLLLLWPLTIRSTCNCM